MDTSKFNADITHFPVNIPVLADMNANDTAYLEYYQTGGAAQTDLAASSFFSGYLVVA